MEHYAPHTKHMFDHLLLANTPLILYQYLDHPFAHKLKHVNLNNNDLEKIHFLPQQQTHHNNPFT